MQQLLITGEMRSGTTFCANFLNSQEDITLFADVLVSLFMEAHQLGVQDINRSLSLREKNVLISNLIQEGINFDADFNFDRDEINSWLDCWNKSLDTLSEIKKNKIIGVKRTREIKFLEQLLEEGVKVIYLLRDPRDVIISAKNRFSAFNFFKSIDSWKESFETSKVFATHSNFYCLRYEKFILDKQAIACDLERFLNVPIKTDLSSFKNKMNKKYIDNSSFGDVTRLFDSNAVERWKKDIQNPEILAIYEILKKEIAIIGYDDSPKLTPKAKQLVKEYYTWKKKTKIKESLKKIASRFLD